MDRSRTFSTVHGERLPGDPHVGVAFYQGGLPFRPDGTLFENHPEITGDPEKLAKVERLKAKAAKFVEKARAKPAPDDEDDEDDDGEEDAAEQEPINLSMWARGEQQLEWQVVTNAIAQRFHVRVKDKRDALERLIQEHVVAPGDLSPKHQKLIRQD